MRRYGALLRPPGAFCAGQSWADCITNTAGSDFRQGQGSTWAIPLVVAVTFHEASHGYVARLCGDDTAWRLGRVSFNPFKHIDPFGTVLLPAMLLLMRSPFLFGYAKPVPVNLISARYGIRAAIRFG